MGKDSDLFRLQKRHNNSCLVSWRIYTQESEEFQTSLWAAAFIVFLLFAKYNVFKYLPVTVLPFGTGICTTAPLLSKNITNKTFLSVRILLAMQGRLAFLVAQI
jgi:hypothetical protein